MVGPFGPDDSHAPRAKPEREWAHKRLEKKRKLRRPITEEDIDRGLRSMR